MEFYHSAFEHGHDSQAILHGIANAITVVDLDPEADPPKVLAIGPDFAGNLLEIIWLELDGGRELIIHAMQLSPSFFALLPTSSD